tara:strand:+ start:9995 stop:10267 length:273 start_codon:yes stop_codon:yes gene_type:complete
LTVTKKILSDNISKKLGVSKKDSSKLLNLFLSFLIENRSVNININNFGSFILRKAPERLGRNPKSGKEYIIKPRMKLSFKPSDEVKKDLN